MTSQRNKLLLAALSALGLLVTATAFAEEMGLRPRSSMLTTAPDPQAFLDDVILLPPRPVVALTLEDAVAKELLREARGMSEVDALRTAQALCEEARTLGYDPLLLLALIK